MKNIIIVFMLFVCCCASTCEPLKISRIKVVNNSNHFTTALFSFQYPDISVPKDNSRMGGVKPNDFRYLDIHKLSEDIFRDLPKDTLSLFFFRVDTLQTYDWEIIRSEYKILKRYDLSLKDLKELNWTITYPPTEAMKDMKQFPPY